MRTHKEISTGWVMLTDDWRHSPHKCFRCRSWSPWSWLWPCGSVRRRRLSWLCQCSWWVQNIAKHTLLAWCIHIQN